MADRISRDAYGLKLAEAAASRADCTRRQVGAVIVNDDGDIVATGYNGAPAGEPGCLSDGACPRGQMSYEDAPAGEGYEETKCIAIHAEVNAVIRAGRSRAKGATIYVTDAPCYHCSIVIRAAGIVRVVTPTSYLEENAIPQRWIVGPGSLFTDAREDPGYSATAADRYMATTPDTTEGGEIIAPERFIRAEDRARQAEALRRFARVWSVGDPEPENVAKVYDLDRDTWFSGECGWYLGDLGDPDPDTWDALLEKYGPVTEAPPSGKDTQ